VLELDPRHEVARDYLEVAGYSAASAGPSGSAPKAVSAAFLHEALVLVEGGSDSEVLDLLENATRENPSQLGPRALDDRRPHLRRRARRAHLDGSVRMPASWTCARELR
jgi:hypothetical protein